MTTTTVTTTVPMAKEDKIITGVFGILLIVLILAGAHEYANSKVCESKGGVFTFSHCLKKDSLLE